MIKLKNVISEAPIDTYATIGNFDKGASFRDKRDRELIKHPTAIQKVKDFFKNTSADFDFYFVNLSGRRKFAEKGKVSKEFVFEPYPKGLGVPPESLKDGQINDNNVTVFFVGNSAAEKVPMTSWTIAHRFGHVLRREYAFNEYAKWLEGQFDEILGLYHITNKDRSGFSASPDYTKSTAKLFNQIGTMKSARDGKIDRPFEFYYELFAQYLYSGKVSFKPLTPTIIKGAGSYGRKEYARTSNVDMVNEILGGIERDFRFYAEDVLSDCVGNVYVM